MNTPHNFDSFFNKDLEKYGEYFMVILITVTLLGTLLTQDYLAEKVKHELLNAMSVNGQEEILIDEQ